jgi:hypothetical protein
LWAAEADGGGDGSLLGADGESVGGVFDVAAGDDSTVREQDSGTDAEVAVRRVRVVGDGDGALLQVCGLRGRERVGVAERIVIRVLVGRHDVSEATGCDG